jgi:hypothetical protein
MSSEASGVNYAGVTFERGERISLDNNAFASCTFRGATLTYSGEGSFSFKDCNIIDFTLDLTGPAKRAVDLLRLLERHGFPVVDGLFPRPARPG